MRLITFVCMVAVSLAAPKPQDGITILRDERIDQGDGNFNYAFELSDGTAVDAIGSPGEGGAVIIRGSYRYTLPNGDVVQITYVADEAGFRPEGDSIPSILPPPLSPIVGSIAFTGDSIKTTDLR